MRRRDEWVKWVRTTADQKSSPPVLTPQEQSGEKVVHDLKNKELNEETVDSVDVTIPPANGASLEPQSLVAETQKVPVGNGTGNIRKMPQVLDQASHLQSGDVKIQSGRNNKIGSIDGSAGPSFIEDIGNADSDAFGGHQSMVSSDMAGQNVDDLSNDFSSTFMLDEELEFEHKTTVKDHMALTGRY